MVTYYAAMGNYRLETLKGDVKHPVMLLGGQEYHVSVAEFVIWTSLLWNILDRSALLAVSARKADAFDSSLDEEVFERTLSRLLFRGLIASGTGKTGAEALQGLMMKTRLVPIRLSLFRKLRGFCSMLRHGHSFFTSLLVFDRDKLSADEEAVWSLLGAEPMTAEEIIFCTGQSTNSDASAPTSAQQVTAVLANLYLKQMVMLDCI